MRLYEADLEQFRQDVISNQIADKIHARYESYYKRKVSPSEHNSWHVSLNFMRNAIDASNLKDNRLVVEYELPYSTRRIDVLIFGKNKDGLENVVLIELKQWSDVEDCEIEGNVVVPSLPRLNKQAPHPALQVEGYHYDLQDFLRVFQESDGMGLSSCAYCHNYVRSKNPVLFAPKFQKYLDKFPVFTREDVRELGAYLQQRLEGGNGLQVFNRFILSPVQPSKKLLTYTKEIISKQRVFNLIDDQIAAYNAIIALSCRAAEESKAVVVIKGGPGTGKSVIALEAMAELMRMGKVVFHATGSSAFTKTLRKILGRRAENLFKFFFSFTQYEDNKIDVLICDEAHRIRKNSNDYGVPFSLRSSRPQIEDLIRPARLSIFFIDENQHVRPKEMGSINLIKQTAEKFKASYYEYELTTQFRCSGSDSFLLWLDDVMGIRNTGKQYLTAKDKMEFKIFPSPNALKKAIDRKNQEVSNSARIVAGFCWPWSAPRSDGSLVPDVKIGSFEMPWERKDQFWKWATDDSGMEQVGTVYTAQGFEFDYIGVIFSEDLVYDPVAKAWKGQPEKSFDTAVTGQNNDVLKHFQNSYRVLLSRAHKGCYVYFMDKATQEYFESRLAEKPKEEAFVDLIEQEINDALKYKEYLPVYSLQAACGAFGRGSDANPLGWMRVDSGVKLNRNMFVAQVFGNSMEPLIKDQSYCVFQANVVGSRQNKVLLMQWNQKIDHENGGSYTVKKYTSRKRYQADESWEHEEIRLLPLNPAFSPIDIPADQAQEFMVIAEFVKTLQ